MGINDRNNSDQFDNAQIVIRDAVANSYGAKVDSNNRLWVQANMSQVPSGLIAMNSKLRYLDMNASNGGVARGSTISTSWVDVFNRSGSGYLFFGIISFETNTDWEIRIIIDDEDLFGIKGISMNDITGNSIYDLDTTGKGNGDLDDHIGIVLGDNNRLTWHPPTGASLYFASNVIFKVKRRAGSASKKFNAGLVSLTDGF